MISLWHHQEALNLRCKQAMLAGHRSVLMQAATGYGKTRSAAAQIETSLLKGKRSIFCVPRKQLLQQTSDSFTQLGIRHGYIASGMPFNPHFQCHIATSGTLVNKLPPADLLFMDEIHYGEGQVDKIIQHYKDCGTFIIGLSATPWKLSGKGLGCWFSHMVCGEQISWLIQHGYLSDYEAYAPNMPDLSGISTQAGDYHKEQVAAFMERDRVIMGDAVKHYKQKAMGYRNLTFCTSIKHSQDMAEAFNASGVPSAHVDGTTGKDELKQIIIAYARREILNLCCAQLLQFGFDLSQAAGMENITVESMSDLEPTKSLSKQMQKWGRALRRKERPAIIFDHVGNFMEHGLPDEDREWSLEDRKRRITHSKERSIPVKQCTQCFHAHKPAPQCPKCGYVYPILSRTIDEVDGDLAAVNKDAMIKARKAEQGKAQTLEALIQLGRQRGYKNPYGWAANVYNARRKR